MREKALQGPRLGSRHSRSVIKYTNLRLDRSRPRGEATTAAWGDGEVAGGSQQRLRSRALSPAAPETEHLSSIPE